MNTNELKDLMEYAWNSITNWVFFLFTIQYISWLERFSMLLNHNSHLFKPIYIDITVFVIVVIFKKKTFKCT